MTQVITIRTAMAKDAVAVGRILSSFVDETPWMPRIHSRAQDLQHADDLIARGWVTVAEAKGVIGFAARDGHTVHALYVAEPARRCGAGRALLHQMQNAVEHLSLWTFQANTDAQAFYAAHGFAPADYTNGAGNDEGLPDIRMTWHREAA